MLPTGSRSALTALAVTGLLGFSLVPAHGAAPVVLPGQFSQSPAASRPFDLRLLPHVNSQGLIALRPAEIARACGESAPRVDGVFRLILGTCLPQMADVDLEAASLPAFSEVEQCVVGFSARAIFSEGNHSSLMLGCGTPGYLRTVRPFDWPAALRKALPEAKQGRYLGRRYFRTPMSHSFRTVLLEHAKKDRPVPPWALYVADDRTVVFGTEDDIKELLDRLKQGTEAPTPVRGWKEMRGCPIAIGFDNTGVPCVEGKWPEDGSKEEKNVRVLVEGLEAVAIGVSGGERIGIRVTATAADAHSARKAVEAIQVLSAVVAAEAEAGNEAGKVIAAGLKKMELSRKGRTVRASVELGGEILQVFQEKPEGKKTSDEGGGGR